MNHALIATFGYWTLIGIGAWLFTQPFVLVIGVLLFPSVMQSLPFMLLPEFQGEEADGSESNEGNHIGFHDKP